MKRVSQKCSFFRAISLEKTTERTIQSSLRSFKKRMIQKTTTFLEPGIYLCSVEAAKVKSKKHEFLCLPIYVSKRNIVQFRGLDIFLFRKLDIFLFCELDQFQVGEEKTSRSQGCDLLVLLADKMSVACWLITSRSFVG